MKQIKKYIGIFLLFLLITSCEKQEPFTFTDKPSFDFVQSESIAALGFVTEPSIEFQVELLLVGNLLKEDKKLKLTASGDARENVDYVLPEFIVFPKDTSRTTFNVILKKAADLESFEDGKTLSLSFQLDESHVAGIRPQTAIKLEGGIPSQWIGYNFWFTYYFVPCTKARYKYLYEKLGFVDFSKHPGFIASSYQMLKATATYLNQQIQIDNAKRVAQGLDRLKDDDGSDLKF